MVSVSGANVKSPTPSKGGGALKVFRRRPTLPDGYPSSTIGAGGLNFRVRDGNGCRPSAIATGKVIRSGKPLLGEAGLKGRVVKERARSG